MSARLPTPDARVPDGTGGGAIPSGSATADRAELTRALAALAEEPREEHRRLAELLDLPSAPEPGVYTELLLMNLYPYASVHLGPEGMLGGEARDRVAGFWRALGMSPPAEPDHLGALLGLLAAVVEREAEEGDPARRTLLARARSALVWEHLLPWTPALLQRVREMGDAYYAGWADLLLELLREERDALTVDRSALPVHLAEAPALPDPRVEVDPADAPDPAGAEGDGRTGEAFLRALLSPVRSGMILTRRDLARCAETVGLGMRQGERLYILKALLAQDAAATLGWLAAEARDQAARHRADPGWDPIIKTFWEGRAEAAARLLEEL
ncbi:MAG TPA: molecular chaperone TorD family protein, partial [Longimicrobiales bacterium]|nr:molecular chaperone TorD family protein [Longimicrobiales bacterium]